MRISFADDNKNAKQIASVVFALCDFIFFFATESVRIEAIRSTRGQKPIVLILANCLFMRLLLTIKWIPFALKIEKNNKEKTTRFVKPQNLVRNCRTWDNLKLH